MKIAILIFTLLTQVIIPICADDDITMSISPNKKYSICLKQDSDTLDISEGGHQLTHHPFDGRLASVFWSPSQQYVAINNHSGHLGWWIWVISLKTGEIITGSGPIKDQNYQRYSDYGYVPEIDGLLDDKVHSVYKDFDSDQMRLGYVSQAYGWDASDKLLVMLTFPFDKLVENDKNVVLVRQYIGIKNDKLVALEAEPQKVSISKINKFFPKSIQDICVVGP